MKTQTYTSQPESFFSKLVPLFEGSLKGCSAGEETNSERIITICPLRETLQDHILYGETRGSLTWGTSTPRALHRIN